MKKIEVFENRPENFCPSVEVAACYVEVNGHILLLQSGLKKEEKGLWGVPAGKLEKEETPIQAASRELLEETAISIVEPAHFIHLGCLYMRKPNLEYIYHLFQVCLFENTPPVCLSEEHQSFGWFAMENLHQVAWMTGAKEGLDHYKKKLAQPKGMS